MTRAQVPFGGGRRGEYVDLAEGGRKLIVLEGRVRGQARPFTFDGRPYHRVETTTSRMPQERYESLLLDRMHARRRWENQPAVGVRIEDLDAEEILRTREDAVRHRRISAATSMDLGDILDRLGLRIDGVLTQAAQMLYGTRFLPDYPQARLKLGASPGTPGASICATPAGRAGSAGGLDPPPWPRPVTLANAAACHGDCGRASERSDLYNCGVVSRYYPWVLLIALGLIGLLAFLLRQAERPQVKPVIESAPAREEAAPVLEPQPAPPLESEEPPGELAVTGVVLDFEGRPVADATVSLHWVNPVNHDDQHNLGVRTRGDGTFVIEAPGAGTCSIRAASDGAFSRRQEIEAGARDVELRFELRWITLRGKVIDPLGGPVAEAMVMLSPRGGSGGIGSFSGADGSFEHRLLEPGGYDLVASKGGFLASELVPVELVSGEVREGVLLRLRSGEGISGRVVDTEGAPVASATVRVATDPFERMNAFALGNSGDERVARAKIPSVLSGDDGTFTFTGLPAGTQCDLFAFKPGFSPPAEVGFTPRYACGQTGIELLLHRLAVLSGTVRGPDGAGVPGIELRLGHLERPTRTGIQNEADSFGARHAAVSTADGAYRFEGVLPGPHVLRVETDRYVPPPRQEITFLEGEVRLDHDLRLEGAVTIRGRVLDTEGEPLPGARVEVSNFEADPGRRMRVETDDEGRFEIADARPGVVYQAWASIEGFRVRAQDAQGVAAPAGTSVDLVLERAHSVSGVVRAAGGTQLSSVSVTPVRKGGEAGGGARQGGSPQPEREFLLRQVEADLVALRVGAEGFVSREVPASFTPGAWHLHVGVIELQSDGASVAGVVLSPSGAPLGGARVSVAGMGFPRWLTEPDGNYELAPLAGGEHQIVVSHPEHPTLRVPVKIDTVRAVLVKNLQLEPGGTLSGVLMGPSGRPRSSRTVVARSVDPERASETAHSGRDGTYHIALAPGRYEVSVVHWRRGHQQVLVPEQPIEIEQGGTSVLDLMLPE